MTLQSLLPTIQSSHLSLPFLITLTLAIPALLLIIKVLCSAPKHLTESSGSQLPLLQNDLGHADDNKENKPGAARDATTKQLHGGKAQKEPKHTTFTGKDLVEIARAVIEHKTLLEPHGKKMKAWAALKDYLVDHGFRHKKMAPEVIWKKTLGMATYKKVCNLMSRAKLFFHKFLMCLEPGQRGS